MKSFADFLSERLDAGGFSTEDVLASMLPLLRQVIDAHNARLVAPLEGLDRLRVEGVAVWFEDSARTPALTRFDKIRKLDPPSKGTFEVVGEHQRTLDLGHGVSERVDKRIGEPGKPIERPVFLPGYISWEHEIEHHDPLSDIFSIGMLLASLACGLDLREPDHLKTFVTHRANPFRINPDLHPVFAKAIVNMTELSRHKRPPDLRAVMRNLENYREQEISIEYDLASIKGFGERDAKGKQQVILGRLQERLFEISRRNRLLHFRDTAGTVCLTEASVPLVLNVDSIRPDQILTWGGRFQKDIVSGKQVPLNRYMNFREALYLGPTLDRIRAESLRDQAEFGFRQLRLVLCFLRWADVKSKPPEEYDSPLALLPTQLIKKKGVRDTYVLDPIGTVAEINPVLRHLMKQLYDIDLPETIDLSEASLDDLYEALKKIVETSDASISLKKIDRPRIDLITERARRRLERYRRRVRLSGRGLRKFMDLDYSYDPINFHPLGLRIFNTWIRPAETKLHRILHPDAEARHFAVPAPDAADAVKERRLYALRDGREGNPYAWEFDLCRVTLGNFRYRKMTLVRDYTELQDTPRPNPAFDATFSLSPRPIETEEPVAPPLAERYDIVPCDPTQAAAIQLARASKSYIIQGPPGTGKSQTITNLIADYVARGKRVLFVCEKRAAIDVVYTRLKQKGIHELCCLIHDSQADKREFVMDLKQTYESFVKEAGEGHHRFARKRERIDALIQNEAAPLDAYAQMMVSEPQAAGVPIQTLFRRGSELVSAQPELSALQMERVPFYARWTQSREQIATFLDNLERVREDRVLARHPLRLLRTELKDTDRPLERVSTALDSAEPLLEQAWAALSELNLPASLRSNMAAVIDLTGFAVQAERLARQRLLRVLDSRSRVGRAFERHLQEYRNAKKSLNEAREGTAHWREKLEPADTGSALEEARRLESAFLPFLRPSWWRMRRILRQRYNFSAHLVWPKWSHILAALEREHQATATLEKTAREMCSACGIKEDVEEVAECVEQLAERAQEEAPRKQLEFLLDLPEPDSAVRALARMDGDLRKAMSVLKSILQDHEDCSPEELLDHLMAVRETLDDLPDFLTCLSDLAEMPSDLARAFRHLPLNPDQQEAASIQRTLDAVSRDHRALRGFDEHQRTLLGRRLCTAHQTWLDLNADVVRERVRGVFIKKLQLTDKPAKELNSEEKEFKKRFNRGRRELEHEFGKTMRYKAIRDLVAGDSGMVVDDLKPIWLMSPLSVSDTLPLAEGRFDVVIFDEASQITLEEAVPALFRAGQAIVVGDEMQLPPTNFFSAKQGEEEGTLWLEEGDETVEYDLSVNSFLSHAAKNLHARMLGWHYRSRSESLISFSNWAFYKGNLLTVPEEELSPTRRPEILIKDPAEGEETYREVLKRAVSFHRLEGAVYQKRRNRAEADYIAHMVRALLRDSEDPTIGIVAFSEAQQDEIENAMERLALEDQEFREQLEAELTREEDGQFVGLLVKNLENIQGDERDIIIMSVCYGYGPDQKMRMNFGPINQSGGERRLNVAFSRSKHHMALVSSIQYQDITNDYNDGANCLKNYLRYAAACSVGDRAGAQHVLRDMCMWRDPEEWSTAGKPSSLAKQIGEALKACGFCVDYSVGMSEFRCDLAVRREEDKAYRLGILLDADPFYRRGDMMEREVFKPQLLTAFGWRIARVLGKDWYEDRAEVLQRLQKMATGEISAEAIEPDPTFAQILDSKMSQDDHEERTDAPGAPAGPPPLPTKTKEILQVQENVPRYFEFIGGASRKFWEITLSDNRYSVRFGRIGTKGQGQSKSYPDADAARRAVQRMINEKLRKGYEEKPPGKE